MFEKEAINLYKSLLEEALMAKGDWKHSPVEDWKKDYFSANLGEANLPDFRRMPYADGMISFPDRPERRNSEVLKNPWLSGIPFWQKVKGLRDISWELYKLNSALEIKFSDVNDNLVGNPCYYRFGKTKVTDFSIRMCFYQKYIEKEFTGFKNANILEIGGGFGGICRNIFSSGKIDVNTYVFVDLPEIMPLAFYYLKNSGINVYPVVCQKDLDNLGKVGNGRKVLLVAPWMLPKMKINFDLFINTMSFQHMTKENVAYYLSEVGRLNAKNLFLVNRDQKRDATDVKIRDYPILGNYILSKEEKYLFSNHLIRIYKIK